ncbi:type VI secretion system baseplate subunit TssK [Chitinimonas sp. PSY-7]|uniref:type VI secretion system baseplate subunit TssK n=1 Tax=Chitinimonas sp. PSY-7 TaxID=3459088 RepID=UPI00403FF0AE
MSNIPRVLWGEGLFLRPQHFQQQDAYHDDRLNEVSQLLHPYGWGVRSVRFDVDALAGGVLVAQELSLVFPDREPFAGPGCDPLPEALQLNAMPDLPDAFLIYAGLPPLRAGAQNVQPEGGNDRRATRFAIDETETWDLFTNAASAEVSVLRRQVRLLTSMHSLDGWITVPLARVRRSQTGGFELDTGFIPPLVNIAASSTLQSMLRRLLDILQAKVSALYGHHREPGKNVIEFRSGDVASFWLLHTASTAYASLLHFHQHPLLHPERLFHQLLTLAGGLMTFTKAYSLSELPVYSHQDLTSSFQKLDEMIRALLETVISTRVFSIAISEVKPAFWAGRLDSEKIDAQTRFYLAVASAMPAAELVEHAPLRFKIGAPDDVEKLVLSAMPGVRLVHVPVVPSAIPVRPGSYYFELEPRGSLYERMLQAQSLQIYVPTGFQDIKLELLAVTQ